MKILYAVQATGNGHITRARTLLPALQQAGIDVDFLFSGRDKARLFDMQCFGDYQHVEGFTFFTHAGKVNPWKTLKQAQLRQFWTDTQQLNLQGYDLLLNDFEPVSAWAAKRRKLPSIGLAHQYALRYALPGTEKAFWLKHAIDLFTPLDRYLGVHWQSFGQPILPPLISLSHLVETEQQDFVLVYLPFEVTKSVVSWLERFPSVTFVVYADVMQTQRSGNVELRPFCRESFPKALQGCKGVICNTGFGLCSEALLLGKKILTKPLAGQIEQYSNACVLERMDRAQVITSFDDDALLNWLHLDAQERIDYPDVAKAVAEWLVSGKDSDAKLLTQELWSE